MHNFFLLDGFRYLKKLDGNGNEIAYIKINKTDDEHIILSDFTHYLFSKNGVYDLSEENIKEVLFKKVINQDRALKHKAWLKLFDEYYNKAQVVVYGNEQYHNFPIYFRIENEWIKLFTEKGEPRTKGVDGLMLKGYPAKFTRTVILKDPLKKVFSNTFEEGWGHLYEKGDSIKNYTFKYSNTSKIKPLFYRKEKIDDLFAYTPIPNSIFGTAYYQLKVKNDILSFKAKTSKLIFRGLENHFNWYILPDTCFQNTDVSFLNLLSPSDYQQSGNSNGLYIIKKKRIN